jgi:hypothetical protein
VAVRSEALDTLNTTLRGMSMSIFGGILAGALVLAGFVTLDVAGLTEARAGLLAMLAFGAAGGLFGVAFAWYVTGGRLPRVTLRRLFGRRLRQFRDDAHSGAAGRGPP